MGRIIASKEIFSPQAYVEMLTGKCYIGNAIRNGYVVSDIQKLLRMNNITDKRSFALNDIEKAISAGKPVVLVDCMYYKGNTLYNEYRWFQK